MIWAYLTSFGTDIFAKLHDPWQIFGLFAQSLFVMRFAVQWIASEKAQNSVVPEAFWYFSIAGSISLLIYGVKQRELVILLGQSFPLVVYVRNLYLMKKAKNKQEALI